MGWWSGRSSRACRKLPSPIVKSLGLAALLTVFAITSGLDLLDTVTVMFNPLSGDRAPLRARKN
jgi:hypothetical protein